jgi:vacuolar-type H+-ATPase subunit C/Vma6
VRFIVDEDVPKSAADFLRERNHDVTLVLDVLLPGSADYLIARWAHENLATVVTCNVRHFRTFKTRPAYGRAGLLGLPQGAAARQRLENLIEVVEAEENLAAVQGRVWVEIRESSAVIGR